MTTPSPRIPLDATAPTSRAAFRLIAKSVGATNKEADRLRAGLLARWVGVGGSYELERRLEALESPEVDGTHAADVLLTVWFSSAEPVDGFLVSEDDPLLAELSADLRKSLAALPVAS